VKETLFAISLINALRFLLCLARLPARERCLEQRWIGVLCIGIIILNDPFCLLLSFLPTPSLAFASALTLPCAAGTFMLFWLIVLDAMLNPPEVSGRSTFFLPKLLLVGGLQLISLVATAQRSLAALAEPLQPDGTAGMLKGSLPLREAHLWQLAACLLGLYTVWLGLLVARTLNVLHKLRQRLRTTCHLTLIGMIAYACCLCLGAFGPREMRAGQLLASTAIVNIYGVALAVCYQPTPVLALRDQYEEEPRLHERLQQAAMVGSAREASSE